MVCYAGMSDLPPDFFDRLPKFNGVYMTGREAASREAARARALPLPDQAESRSFPIRAGNLFSIVIFKITGKSAKSCGRCGKRMRQMNDWGWWGCWKNRNIIIGWLIEEARARGHEIDKGLVLSLFKAAFKELRDLVGRAL